MPPWVRRTRTTSCCHQVPALDVALEGGTDTQGGGSQLAPAAVTKPALPDSVMVCWSNVQLAGEAERAQRVAESAVRSAAKTCIADAIRTREVSGHPALLPGGGQVYVMHNPLDPPNLFKIGMTKLTTARLHKRWHPWEDALAALVDEYTPWLRVGAAAVSGAAGGIFQAKASLFVLLGRTSRNANSNRRSSGGSNLLTVRRVPQQEDYVMDSACTNLNILLREQPNRATADVTLPSLLIPTSSTALLHLPFHLIQGRQRRKTSGVLSPK